MKRWLLWVALTCLFSLAMAANHPRPHKPKVVYHGTAIVNRVEPILGLLNLSHSSVPEFGWQPMTRDLPVKPSSLAQGLMPGMQIRFQLTAIDPLTYVITALEPIQ